MRSAQTTIAVILVGFSLLLSLALAGFQGGLTATPYGTKDSKGVALGFNQRLSTELYGIIWGNASTQAVAKAIGVHGIFCLLLQVAAIGMLFVTRRKSRSTARDLFFGSQFPIFLNGLLGLLYAPFIGYSILTGTADGETFSDGVPVTWIGHGFWMFVSFTILVLSWLSRRDAVRQEEWSTPLEH